MQTQYKAKRKFFKTSAGVTNGVVVGNTFRRDVVRERHFVWKYVGYGLDAREAERLNTAGVSWVVFIEKPDDIEYSISMSEFLANGIRDRLGGFELQIFIPLSAMSKTSPVNVSSQALPRDGVRFKEGTRTPKQLSLFGGRE